MTDKAKSAIRTAWPMLLGHLAAWLVASAAPLGIEIDSVFAAEALGWALGTLVYLAGRFLERRDWPVNRAAGRFLLSLGFDLGQPLYPPARPRA